VFTAGIGENAAAIREAVVRRLSWLGLELDPAANAGGRPRISRREARVACYIIPTES
jgi:acetate kinase